MNYGGKKQKPVKFQDVSGGGRPSNDIHLIIIKCKIEVMKFLIVDDDSDLLEVLSMIVVSNYNVEIVEAKDGQTAIDNIKSAGPFDLVICDYNMPHKNGADVYRELRKENAGTPFILISTDIDKFKRQFLAITNCGYVDKPFAEKDLIGKIEELLSQKSMVSQSESYLPVSIEILEKIVFPGVALFIRLNHGQYIKVIAHDGNFDANEANRFRNKKLTHLYVELIEFKTLISNFRKNVFSSIDWNNVDTSEALANLQPDWKLILDSSRNFGWSDSIQTLAKENIAKSIMLIKKVPKLKECLDKLKLSSSGSQVTPHSYFLAIFATAVLTELDWANPGTMQKVTFAALLHDMELTDEAFLSKLSRLSGKVLESEINQQTNLKIYSHPIRAAEFVNFWTSCPPDVDKLIIQHHENFDGTGFPNKLDYSTLFPLAGLMIMAEDVIYQSMTTTNANAVTYLKSREAYYCRGEFKKIFQATLKVLEASNAN